jgi:hypothetical protein
MLKYLLSILLFTSAGVASAQKPILGYTIEQIKTYNRMEFGTTQWDNYIKNDFYVLETYLPQLEVGTLYFFRLNGDINIMCGHTTKNRVSASLIFDKIKEATINIGNGEYYNPNDGITVKCNYSDGVYTFLFYRD